MQDVLNPLRDRNSYAVTADTTLQRAQVADCLVHNTGATGTVIVTLPAGTAKMKARFLRTAAYTLTIDPNGTEIIKGTDGVSLGAGVAKDLTSDGAYCELEHDGVAWNVIIERVDGTITTAQIADDAVTAAKVADGAIDAAAKIGAGVVSLAKLSTTVKPKQGTFTGAAAAGAITLTGAAVGDRVLAVWQSGVVTGNLTPATLGTVTEGGSDTALFEATITVANQIQQASAANQTDKKFTVILIPAAA